MVSLDITPGFTGRPAIWPIQRLPWLSTFSFARSDQDLFYLTAFQIACPTQSGAGIWPGIIRCHLVLRIGLGQTSAVSSATTAVMRLIAVAREAANCASNWSTKTIKQFTLVTIRLCSARGGIGMANSRASVRLMLG
jgi:hypothetical protein